ncbi:MAG TPA: hydroxymethylbilane synthase [Acidimicrobiia bacterium]|nr:hydroxymethylbilane synthase [Acidimicrobiia bacterium]
MADLRIATRGSDLARAQARWVAARLEDANPGLETSLVEVPTTGDRDRVTPVATLTEVGAFVRAVQRAVLDGSADIAVHSCKDLPVEGPDDLMSFYPERESPWDVLCGHDPETLPPGAKIGTGSPRRAAQLKALRPDLIVADIRGNVDTRLERMHRGDYDAVVLAEAGLRRLGLAGEIDHRFTIGEMVPAPAQGALAVEGREGDPLIGLLERIDDPSTRLAVETERALLEDTRAGCRSALGALAEVEPMTIRFTGFVADEDGARSAVALGSDSQSAARSLREKLDL